MKSWTVYVPPGEGGKLEELVHLDKEENLMYLETLHICHVALGEGTKKGEKVLVKMRTPEGTFTFGTLQEGRTEQFASDIYMDQDVLFTHTGQGNVFLAGYKARLDPDEVISDDEKEEDWKKANARTKKEEPALDIEDEDDDDDDEMEEEEIDEEEEEEEDEEDEDDELADRKPNKGEKKPNTIEALLSKEAEEDEDEEDEEDEGDEDEEEMDDMADDDDEDEDDDEDQDDIVPKKENGKAKHKLELTTPINKQNKKSKIETPQGVTASKATPVTNTKTGDDKGTFESAIRSFLEKNGNSTLSAIGGSVKKPVSIP